MPDISVATTIAEVGVHNGWEFLRLFMEGSDEQVQQFLKTKGKQHKISVQDTGIKSLWHFVSKVLIGGLYVLCTPLLLFILLGALSRVTGKKFGPKVAHLPNEMR